MIQTICAVCRKKNPVKVLYKSNFKAADINPQVYTSRRVPDRVHFRIVRCLVCGLTFSNPIYEAKKILDSYKRSANPTTEDLKNSALVYISYLKNIIKNLPSKDKLLDIGCGDGFFLLEAKKLGFRELYGVEPSKEAISKLEPGINGKNIINDVFKKGQFKKNLFDIVCFFQVLDHVVDPNEFLKNCHDIIRPGGYILAIMHDAKFLTNIIMGEKSPIIDIQHIYLFDKETIRKIFQNNGFNVVKVFNTFNLYSLGYWLEMAPLPSLFRNFVLRNWEFPLFRIPIPLKIGNMAAVAKK